LAVRARASLDDDDDDDSTHSTTDSLLSRGGSRPRRANCKTSRVSLIILKFVLVPPPPALWIDWVGVSFSPMTMTNEEAGKRLLGSRGR